MNDLLPALQWKQNGVIHILKLLPGGRIGQLSDELLAEIRTGNGGAEEKIQAIHRGDIAAVRRLQKPEGRELATVPLREWEETLAGPSGPFRVTFVQPEAAPARPGGGCSPVLTGCLPLCTRRSPPPPRQACLGSR